jgi:hypothetical protein
MKKLLKAMGIEISDQLKAQEVETEVDLKRTLGIK